MAAVLFVLLLLALPHAGWAAAPVGTVEEREVVLGGGAAHRVALFTLPERFRAWPPFGATRLVCAHARRIVESHPYPTTLSLSNAQGKPPAFLLPVGGPERTVVHPLQLFLGAVAATDDGRVRLALVDGLIDRPEACVLRFSRADERNVPVAREEDDEQQLEGVDVAFERVAPAPVGAAARVVPTAAGMHPREFLACGEEHTEVLLQTETRERHRVAMYERFLANNPIEGAMGPVADALGGAVSGPLGAMMDPDLMHKIVPGMHDGITYRLTERIVPPLVQMLPPQVAAGVPANLVDQVPATVSEKLVKTVPYIMTPLTTRKVARGTAGPIPEDVNDETPRQFVRQTAEGMAAVLTKAIAHAIAPAFKATLSGTARHVRCYYCRYDASHGSQREGLCDDCESGGNAVSRSKDLEDASYYASYYSQHFSQYYAQSNFVGIEDAEEDSQEKKDYWGDTRP